MTIDDYINQAKSEFDSALKHLQEEYAKLQIGRASAALVEDLQIESYGSMQPLKAVATISIPDPRTIQIQPWDRSNLTPIESAIKDSDINVTPTNDGAVIRISIPPMTEERRQELVKLVHKLAEDSRISIRNHRQSAHTGFKQLQQNNEITEDDFYDADKKLQTKVDDANNSIEELAKNKETDILTV